MLGGGMLTSGFNIHSSELLPPDFFAVADWHNAQATATPQWTSIWMIDGKAFAHPSLIEKLKRAS